MAWCLICRFASIEKTMVMHDTECPNWDQVPLNNTNSNCDIPCRWHKWDKYKQPPCPHHITWESGFHYLHDLFRATICLWAAHISSLDIFYYSTIFRSVDTGCMSKTNFHWWHVLLWGCISVLLPVPRLFKLPSQSYSNEPGNLGNLGSNRKYNLNACKTQTILSKVLT